MSKEQLLSSTVGCPKILCLHGFGQTISMFHERLKSTMSNNKGAQFTFVVAPHNLCNKDTEESKRVQGWWFYDKEKPLQLDWNTLIAQKHCKELLGLDASVQYLREHLEHNKYDVILGFSQGAAMLAVLNTTLDLSNMRLIFVGGFIPIKTDELSLVKSVKPQKTLHVFGEKDTVISTKYSEDLAGLYPGAEILKHRNAHVIPRLSKTQLLGK